jgi:stress response protein YsnF
MEEVPVEERVELLEEEFQVENRPVNRRLTEEEVERSGLLQDRVIQFAAMREEAVVSKQPFVREEVVVRKQVTERVEEIRDSVRRTQVETERLEPGETGR